MGLLIDGKWHDKWYDTAKDGRFQRESARRRNWITLDGGRWRLFRRSRALSGG
jgi:putative glutathione S-transferase